MNRETDRTARGSREDGRYRFIGEHGHGGLGRVSRVHDRKLGRDIAIKEILTRKPLSEVRLMREALITARLEHPGIVPVYEVDHWADGAPFYAMKLVSGRPLRDLIAERPTVSERLGLLHHVIAVADAIAYAHDHQIIHRDLKPANVIIGDYGETIVIDWGLAKELSAVDDASAPSSGTGYHTGAGLTTTGAILGTPAYMPPEQARGEPVDQRADVFAIGAMLWELCAIERVPPTDPVVRRDLFRRSGIDRDLAAIVDKALAPDPAQRYPNAGALAADLRAFKAGARIGARNYSLLALLTHWTRRHRTLALSVAAIAILALVGGIAYVRAVTLERARADAALDELTIKHTELQLTTDPSAALDVLATYHGSDAARAAQLRAEAVGHGVARLRAMPHTNNQFWLEATRDGAVMSLSWDGSITRTEADGSTRVLARGVARVEPFAYAAGRHLLAYACDPADVCLLDAGRGAPLAVDPALRSAHAVDLAFSPSGDLLATVTGDGAVRVFDARDPAHLVLRGQRAVAPGNPLLNVLFIDEQRLAVSTATGFELIQVPVDQAPASESFEIADVARWDADPARHDIAAGTSRGEAVLITTAPLAIAAKAELCHGPIVGLRFVTDARPTLAFACREGTIGTWDVEQGTIRAWVRLDGHADLVVPSDDGDYLIAAGGHSEVAVIDRTTSFVTHYHGHSFRVMALLPPSPEHPFIVSADSNGGIRTWPVPARRVRVVATATAPMNFPMFTSTGALVATTWLTSLTMFDPVRGASTATGHASANVLLEMAPSGQEFAAYGGDRVELWPLPALSPPRTIATGHGGVSSLRFAGEHMITAGRDGRLVRWSADGEPTELAHVAGSIVDFAIPAAIGAIVVATSEGALWRIDPSGATRPLRDHGPKITRLVADPGGRAIYLGDATGALSVIDVGSGQITAVHQSAGAINRIAISGDGQTLAVTSSNDTLAIGTRRADGFAWLSSIVHARDVGVTREGRVVAIDNDNALWIFDRATARWECLPLGTADVTRLAVSPDGHHAGVVAREGQLIWIDLTPHHELYGKDDT